MARKSNKKQIETSNIYAYLAYKFLIALMALLIAQIFFHICNLHLFHIEGFNNWMRLILGNIVFGVFTVALVLLPFLVLNLIPGSWRWNRGARIISEILYVIPVLFITITTCCDGPYFQHTFRLLSSEIFAYLGIGGQMGSLVPLFIRDYWFVSLGLIASILPWAWLDSRIALTERSHHKSHGLKDIIGMIVGLTIIAIPASLPNPVLSLKDAGRFCDPKDSALVVNSGYSILRTLAEDHLPEYNFMSDEEAQRLFNPEFQSLKHQALINADSTITNDTMSPKNIVILMVESLSQEYMGCYNPNAERSYTPFLDELASRSHVYQGRSNGKKSIESIPAICASLPTLMEMPIIMSQYNKNAMNGLPAVLARHGYKSAIFHGGYNGTMNFEQFCYQLGADDYFGMDEYIGAGGSMDNYDKAWGIYDEPFLQYMVNQLNNYDTPFFSLCFTVTSHHPFPIPEQYKNVFPKGPHKILECVGYTDYALRKFFEAAEKTDWYNNTLFIITADHPGYVLSRPYSEYDGLYKTPMIVFDPQNNEHFVSSQIIQQIDLMPTIIDYLNLDETCVCFGNSIFQRNDSGYQIAYGNGFYVMNYDDGHAVVEGSTEIGDPQHLRLLKAILQQYTKRMRNNQLTIQ